MFNTKDSIKFMMAKMFFLLADFTYHTINEVTPLIYHGTKTIEINYIRHGNGKVQIDDEIYEIYEGSYIVIPEFVSYSLIPNGDIDLYSVYLLIEDDRAYKEYLPLSKKYMIGNDTRLSYLFDDLLNEFKNKQLGYNELIVSDFKNIIVKLLRNEGIKGKRLSHWSTTSLQFEIENIFKEEFSTITVIDLANRLHLSIRELQRYLIKNYKKSFNEIKTDAKMSFASNKLLYTKIKISELAELVGYSTPEHFSYAFKKYYGISPVEYKKKNKIA